MRRIWREKFEGGKGEMTGHGERVCFTQASDNTGESCM